MSPGCATRAISTRRWQSLTGRIESVVADQHEARPDSVGPRESDVLREVRELGHREMARAALESLVREGKLVREGLALRRSDHTPQLPAEDEAFWSAVSPHVLPESLHPLAVGDLAKRLEQPLDQVQQGLERLARRGRLVRVDRNRYLHPAAVAHLARIAEELAQGSEDGRFDARAYRDASGIGRNLSISPSYFHGMMDEVRLYARTMDEAEIVANYNAAAGRDSHRGGRDRARSCRRDHF